MNCLALLLFFLVSCNSPNKDKPSEGLIVYRITPINKGHWLASLAPKEMHLYFKDERYVATMSAMGGIFTSKVMEDSSKKFMIQAVKVWRDKMYTSQSLSLLTDELGLNFEPVKTNDKKEIVGMTCSRYLFRKGSTSDTFSVWSTENLELKSPSFFPNHHSFNGFPLDFTMRKFGLDCRFVAKKITFGNVSDKLFEVPSDYHKITLDSLNAYFQRLK